MARTQRRLRAVAHNKQYFCDLFAATRTPAVARTPRPGILLGPAV